MIGSTSNDQKRVEFMISKLKIERLEGFLKGMEFQEPRQLIGDKKYKDYVVQNAIFADESNAQELIKLIDKEAEYNRQLAVFIDKQKGKERARAMSVYREGYFRCINDMINNRDLKLADSKNQQPSQSAQQPK